MSEPGLNEDFLDLLRALQSTGAEYLVVGAYAMAVHGVPRATGDLDLWVRPTGANADRVLAALVTFGAPVDLHAILRQDLETPGTVYQIGLPPRRIDLLTSVTGLVFEEAWPARLEVDLAGLRIHVLGREDVIRNKRAAGRDKDFLDLKLLEAPAD
jgi:predicted nucleotidyltransferase